MIEAVVSQVAAHQPVVDLRETERLLSGILAALAGGAPVKAVNSTPLQGARPASDRPSKQLQKALEWLVAHPEHLDTPSRNLQDTIGVSHMTVYKAQQLLKQPGVAADGENENENDSARNVPGTGMEC